MAPDARARLETEVRLLRSVRHANVIDFFGAWSAGDRFVFITEVVEAGDLAEGEPTSYAFHCLPQRTRVEIVRV